MFATIDDSTYVENTQMATEALSHKHTVEASLPDLEPSNITITGFESTFDTLVSGDKIIVFSAEFPTGIEDIINTATLITPEGDASIDSTDYTFTNVYVDIPTGIYDYNIAKLQVLVQAESTDDLDRMVPLDTPLVFTSATATEFVGVLDKPGVLAVDDTLIVSDGIAPEEVILTDVVESGTAPDITYTCTYSDAVVATEDAIIPARQTPVEFLTATRTINTVSNGGTDVIIKYASTQFTPPNGWAEISRKIIASRGWTINTPFTMTYVEAI